MNWHTGPLLPFDLETTSPDPNTARIVTAYAHHIGTPDQWSWLADPGVDIPEGATAVHGITTEHARQEGAPATAVVGEIRDVLQWAADNAIPVIGHNAAYDLTVTDRECRRHGIEPPDWDHLLVIDTLVLDKHVWPYRPGSRKLTDVAALYGVPIRGDAHDAAADALAAARIGHRIATIGATPTEDRAPEHTEWKYGKPTQRFEDAAAPADQLHLWQTMWAAEQAESLERYFRKQPGRESEVVDRHWPVRPAPPNWDPTATDPQEVTA